MSVAGLPGGEWAKFSGKVFSLSGMFARSWPFRSRPEMRGDVYLLPYTCIYSHQGQDHLRFGFLLAVEKTKAIV